MKTPMEKYCSDVVYKTFVDAVHSALMQAQMTPSEVREAAMLACIMYEEHNVRRRGLVVNPEVMTALDTLRTWTQKEVR